MDESNASCAVNSTVNNLAASGTPRHRHLTRSTTGSSGSSAGTVTATASTSNNLTSNSSSLTTNNNNMANNSFNSTSNSKRSPGTALRRKRASVSSNVQRKNLNVKVASIKKNTATKAASAIRKGPIRTSRLHLNTSNSRPIESSPVKHGPGRRKKVSSTATPNTDVKCQPDASSKSNFKIDIHAFLRHMMNENVRHEYIKQVDEHVNKLLDAVKCKEKGSGKRGKGSNQHRSQASQIAETKDKKIIDLSSPDSILSHISNPRILLNATSFASLPLFYQFKLVKMLPHCDQVITDQGWIKPSASSLTNEFFTKASLGWCENLKEGKFTSDYLQRKKLEMEREKSRLDPWKLKYFEPIWGRKLVSQGSSSHCEDMASPSKSLPPLDPVLCHIKTKAATQSLVEKSKYPETVSSNSETEEELITENNIVSDDVTIEINAVQPKTVASKKLVRRRGKSLTGPLSKKLKKSSEDVIASVVPEQFDSITDPIEDATSHIITEAKDDSYLTIGDAEQSTNYNELTVTHSSTNKLLNDSTNVDRLSSSTQVSRSIVKDKQQVDEASDLSEDATLNSDDYEDTFDEDDEEEEEEEGEEDDDDDDDDTNENYMNFKSCPQSNGGKLYLPSSCMSTTLDGLPAAQIPRELQIIPVMANGDKSEPPSNLLNGDGVNVIALKSSKIITPQILNNILKKQSIESVSNKNDTCVTDKSSHITLPYKLPEGLSILPCTNKENDSISLTNDKNISTPHQVPVITKSESSTHNSHHLSSSVWTSDCSDQLHRLPPQITVIPISTATDVDGSCEESSNTSCASRENSSGGDSHDGNIFSQYSIPDDCACNLKPLVRCSKCGAFCHADCMDSSTICVDCIMRCNPFVPQIQPSTGPSVINDCNSPFLYPI